MQYLSGLNPATAAYLQLSKSYWSRQGSSERLTGPVRLCLHRWQSSRALILRKNKPDANSIQNTQSSLRGFSSTSSLCIPQHTLQLVQTDQTDREWGKTPTKERWSSPQQLSRNMIPLWIVYNQTKLQGLNCVWCHIEKEMLKLSQF